MRIRYYGHVGQLTGYGRAADKLCMALLTQPDVELEIMPPPRGIPGAPVSFSEDQQNLALAQYLVRDADNADPYSPDVIVVHTLPFDCRRVLERTKNLRSAALLVAYTTWEMEVPPELPASLKAFDQLWVPSNASSISHADMRVVHHPFDLDTLEERRRSPRIRPPDAPFSFYYVGAWNERKNVNGLVRAYVNAFRPGDDVELVLQCRGATREQLYSALGSTGIPAGELPRIRFNNTEQSCRAVHELHQDLDCFVTATRGEAFNLPAFDAAVAGRTIITPLNGAEEFRDAAVSGHWSTMWWFLHTTRQPAFNEIRNLRIENGGIHMEMMGPPGVTSRLSWQEPDLSNLVDLLHDQVRAGNARDPEPGPRMLEVIRERWAPFDYKHVGRQMVANLQAATRGEREWT